MDNLSPIAIFTYKRPSLTKQTIEALKKNYLASESEIFIFSDGPKDDGSIRKIKEVRTYLNSISGFKKVTLIERDKNWGLANSIIDGVSTILRKYGKIIVVEDDLITSPNFLNFMNQGLNFYENIHKVFSITGYTFNLPSLAKYDSDFYTGYRASSWGWGTWNDRWIDIDWNVSDYNKFRKDLIQQVKFTRAGIDMPKMLKKQMNGEIDSWAIRWCYHQFLRNTLTVFPSVSMVQNIGFGIDATHTKSPGRFITTIDDGNKKHFTFTKDIKINKRLAREFKSQFSLWKRFRN